MIDGGKLPPQATEAEEAVLGALLTHKEALQDISGLVPDNFYKSSNKIIFSAILELDSENEPIDLLTVKEKLSKSGELDVVGGIYYVSELTNKVASAANIEVHSRIIVEKWVKRELIRVSQLAFTEAYNETSDTFDLLDKAESALYSIKDSIDRRRVTNMADSYDETMKRIEDAKKAQEEGTPPGIPTGLKSYDAKTGGVRGPDFIVLAARPGMGKTTFALQIAINQGIFGDTPVGYFSLEMSTTQLIEKILSNLASVGGESIKQGTLTDSGITSLQAATSQAKKGGIYIDDTPALTPFELKSKLRRMISNHGVKVCFVDYLQLMEDIKDHKTRESEVSQISRQLKAIAKEFDIPIIALAQLSRAVETRGGDKIPQLSDLRESGSIEQDADMVAFIYRAEYYGITQFAEGESTANVMQVICEKHRAGGLFNINCSVDLSTSKVFDHVYNATINPQITSDDDVAF